MAESYYGYERLRPGDALGIDMSTVLGDLRKDIEKYEKERGENKEAIAAANRDLATQLASMPNSFATEYNAFWARSSNDAMKAATAVNDLWRNGKISKQERDTKIANLESQTKLLVNGLTTYVTGENEKQLQAGPNGSMSQEEIFEWQQAQVYSDLANVSIVFDPDTYQVNMVRVDPETGAMETMSVNEYFNIVNSKGVGKYDTAGNVNTELATMGMKDVTDADGNIIKGRTITEAGDKATEALEHAARAMVSQSTDVRGILSVNPISINEEGNFDPTGEAINFDYKKLPSDVYGPGGVIDEDKIAKLLEENPYTFYQDKNGKYYQSDKANDLAYQYAYYRLDLAADLKKTSPQVTPTDPGKAYDRFRLGLELVNRAGKKIPDYLLKLALTSIPGMDEEAAAELFGDLTFEDKDTRTASQQEKDRNAARDKKILNAANEWYENVFLKDVVDDETKYNIEQIDEMLLNTPYTVDTKEGEIKLGDDVIYKFDKKNKIKGKDIKRFKTKLKALLGNEQEVGLFFSANPEMMTKDWGAVEVEVNTDKYN
jgi:hypothetical protein